MVVEIILPLGELVKIEENGYRHCFTGVEEVKCEVASLQEVVEAITSSNYAIFVFRSPEAVMRQFLELVNAIIDRASREGKRIQIVVKIPKTHEERPPITDPRDLLFKAFAYMEITP
jgi:hypothetical protein